jgi:dTDP-4-amino-4,6-dideoxygalactose transaminase
MRNGYFAGTKSDIGGFSLNYHKHIHSGEGGVVVTNSDDLAHRMQLLRNHGEVLVGSDYTNNPPFGIMGMNMRMGEIEAAIATNQLTKLSNAIASRKEAALLFEEYLKDLPGLTLPKVMPGNNHVYYIFGLKIDTQITGIDRESLVSALRAEGVPAINNGYQNIHALPLFRNQMTYKNNPLPYSLLSIKRQKEIRTTRLEKAEDLHLRTFIGINWCAKKFVKKDVQMVGEAFQKVWKNLENLKHAFS